MFIGEIFQGRIPWQHVDLAQQYLTSISLRYGFNDIDIFDWNRFTVHSWLYNAHWFSSAEL